MSDSALFKLVIVGYYVIPIIIFLILHFWLKSKSQKIKIISGILVSWLVLIFYVFYIYNSAGIAAGHETGMVFPEGKYDNNTTSIILFFGWMYPTMVAIIYSILINIWKKYSNSKNIA
jgi:4-amino-4-deoxy-L-arabinose transferase-like glycosyltransferase